jgi:hypothetical protein
VPSHDVAEVPDTAHLDQDNPFRYAPQRESSLKHDVRASLSGRQDFRVVIPVRIFGRSDTISSGVHSTTTAWAFSIAASTTSLM